VWKGKSTNPISEEGKNNEIELEEKARDIMTRTIYDYIRSFCKECIEY
jgi:hypothetical protein